MPLPILAPIIGGLIGTAAAPALGMSAALAAGLGSFAGGILSGQNPAQAALGGIMGALVPGVAGVVGKGAEAATQATTQAATGGAQMTANQIAQQTAASSLGPAATKEALTQATKGIGSIDPGAALEMSAQMLSGGQERERQAPPVGPLRMRLGEEQAPTSVDAMSNFLSQQAPSVGATPVAPAPLVVAEMEDPERKFIPLRLATGGVASLARAEMARRGMDRLPNLGNREQAYAAARQEFARGGYIEGPGTGTSDDIPAKIMQNGIPVDEALLSDGEVVLSHRDLAAADPDGDSRRAGQIIGNAPNGTRAKKAAELFMKMPEFKERAA